MGKFFTTYEVLLNARTGIWVGPDFLETQTEGTLDPKPSWKLKWFGRSLNARLPSHCQLRISISSQKWFIS